MPGTPARDPVTVYISARYISNGFEVRSPNLNGGTGGGGAVWFWGGGGRRLNVSAKFRVKSFGEVVIGNADAQTGERTAKRGSVIRYRRGGGCGVQRIAPCERGHHGGGITNRACERANAVQRRRERDQTVARNASVTRHHCRDAAERAGLTD